MARYFILAGLLLTACNQAATPSVSDTLNGIYKEMQKNYYWQDHLPNINPQSYATPEALLDALKYKPTDRYSFMITSTEYQRQYGSGQDVGLGIQYVQHDNDLQISVVQPYSPAAKLLSRGDKIVAVNGTAITAGITPSTLFGAKTEGLTVVLKVQRGSTVFETSITKALYDLSTVPYSNKINGSVGYAVYTSFLDAKSSEIFEALKNLQGIDTLILDLRYNGGGSLNLAADIASAIQPNLTGKVFSKLNFYSKSSYQNMPILFSNNAIIGFQPKTLYVLTSQATCSASEALIQGLKPFMDVIMVGETTCGKPVGMIPTTIGDRVLFAINFEVLNSQNQGGYFSGLIPQCQAADELNKALGDTTETGLQTALRRLSTGSCPVSTQSSPREMKNLAAREWLWQ